jgi:porin
MSISPSDRNLIDRYVDGGIIFAGLLPARPHDRFGVSMIYAHFSRGAQAFDRDLIAFTGLPVPIRDFEANLEFNYTWEVVPGWLMQPVVTRIWHPDGDASRNAWVTGMRTLIRY